MSVIQNNLLMTPEGYQISRSVRLRSSASAYFSRTPGSTTNRQIMTWSGWVKRGSLSDSGYMYLFGAYPGSSATDTINFINGTLRVWFNGSSSADLVTTQVFRDPSAWYHIVVAIDTTQATSSNRIKVYVNGSQITSFSTASYPTQNYNTYWNNSSYSNQLGANGNGPASFFDGYLTEINFIDGQALTPSSFGETDLITGVWKPKKYTGTYGTNGFFLNFSDNSAATAAAIGKDMSGNANNWTPNNISVTAGVTYDSMLDTPTPYADGGNGRGNYAVVNSLPPSSSGGSWYTQDGNLKLIRNGAGWTTSIATIGVTSGKWYWEIIPQNSGNQFTIGVAKDGYDWTTYLGSNAFGWSYIGGTGDKYTGGVNTAYGATYTTNDVIGVAFDADAGTLTFYKNGTSQGQAYSGLTSGPYYPACGVSNVNTAAVFNFGQRPFTYTPPTGFKALNTQNLPDATIKAGNKYFDATTYTGNSGTLSVVNSGGFQPDLVWGKARNAAVDHGLYDSVRGVSKRISSNLTGAEITDSGVTSFNSNGFTLGSSTSMNDPNPYVAWQWKKGATQGFDIVTYTGTGVARTVAHSLGVAPKMVIVKSRSNAISAPAWPVYHGSLAASLYLDLQTTIASTTASSVWNSTAPTSTDFSVGTTTSCNGSGMTYVAYLFAEVAGYSKFGSYTGNGSTDGPFCYTGFRPRWVMLKRTDAVASWVILDTSRDTYNAAGLDLYPNTSDAETDNRPRLDILSNGFKLRANANVSNLSGGTYVYAAFGENPFKFSNAR